eukprot:scpid5919/ scgid15576/ 
MQVCTCMYFGGICYTAAFRRCVVVNRFICFYKSRPGAECCTVMSMKTDACKEISRRCRRVLGVRPVWMVSTSHLYRSAAAQYSLAAVLDSAVHARCYTVLYTHTPRPLPLQTQWREQRRDSAQDSVSWHRTVHLGTDLLMPVYSVSGIALTHSIQYRDTANTVDSGQWTVDSAGTLVVEMVFRYQDGLGRCTSRTSECCLLLHPQVPDFLLDLLRLLPADQRDAIVRSDGRGRLIIQVSYVGRAKSG